MTIQRLEFVDLPDPRATTLFEISTIPGISGKGDASYECPSCNSILLENIVSPDFTRIAFRCPACGALSQMPDKHRRAPRPDVSNS